MPIYLKLTLLLIPLAILTSVNINDPKLSISSAVLPSPSPTSTPTATPRPTVTPSPKPKPTLTPSPKPRPSATLTPFPTPTPIIATSQQLDSWFTHYSNQYSVDREKLWSIAVCESKLNANARNGDYAGMYQFSSNTWQSTRKAMNLDSNPELRFNPEEAIKTAAFKISAGGISSWKNCVK